ncbi:hypothetical protein Lgra_2161 [Legionella gratiana]|uniref:Uncharacterized protein n=1 Tax=Legionella gratiana TaxID=45066 RepID=A0A378JA95_9GAMM|nr:hypothetical protein [Legionella gratiana]KTD11195.1 hypothetical protein Lgra_2161 [Legionella gratiana]STX44286.1 Uncharacterised protein [Legionella gratiana]
MNKHVILSFDRGDPEVTLAFQQRIQAREAKRGIQIDLDDIKVIYLADLSNEEYMTWTGISPSEKDKEILQSLEGDDKVYLWGHGTPNSGYIPGGFYTEIADYLEKGLNKDNFSPSKGPLDVCVEICSGGKGGEHGKNSFAASLHAYLGKIGIFSKVTGRMSILWLDHNTLSNSGAQTVNRAYYGMTQALNLPVEAEKLHHQAPRSKVTYMWDPTESEHQIRIDSYRSSLFDEFIRLKEKILANAHDLKINYTELHRLLLKIEFSLSDHTRPLDVELLKSCLQTLADDFSQVLEGNENETIRYELEHLNDAIQRKAHANGFIVEATGLHKSDPKLPIEEKSFAEVIYDLPVLKRMDEIASLLKEQGNIPQEILDIIGSKETKGEDNCYAHFFTTARKHIIRQHNGTTNIPESLIKPMAIVNKMLETVLLDNDKPLNEKKAIFNELKGEINIDYSPTLFNKCAAWIAGLMFGLQLAFNERHETNLTELIPNLFFSAYTLSSYYLDTFLYTCEQVEKITNACSDTLKALEPPCRKSISPLSFFAPQKDETKALDPAIDDKPNAIIKVC